MTGKNKSHEPLSFNHRQLHTADGFLVGYSNLIQRYNLNVPLPFKLSVINNNSQKSEFDGWQTFPLKYKPEDSLKGNLTFALKYEGVDLGVLNALFKTIDRKEILRLIKLEPTSSYGRRIWFLYEWLTGEKLKLNDLKTGNYVELVDDRIQYGISPVNSSRHRIRNNLSGVPEFCPMIRKTEKLEKYLKKDYGKILKKVLAKIHPDIIRRASAFLLLSDSKASYIIEKEKTPVDRIQRWANVLARAGMNQLTITELVELQKIVIGDSRFIQSGLRKEGGFIGSRDRITNEPIPDHISAKWSDLKLLTDGLLRANVKMEEGNYNQVLHAASISFGFVFIHPFVDGNGRIHRYLINDILTRRGFASKGFILPISIVILNRISEYKKILESYSSGLKDLIKWKVTDEKNVEVLNDTLDLYRFFDATTQAEFLFDCINEMIEKTLPEEVVYLQKFDKMKNFLDDNFSMPDNKVELLINFLNQNNGILSSRAKSKEFKLLKSNEVKKIESEFQKIFTLNNS